MRVERLTTGAPPVTLERLADFMRVDIADPDLEAILLTAASELELYAAIALTDQTIEATTEGAPGPVIELPVGPVSTPPSLTLETIDQAGNVSQLSQGFFVETGRHPLIRFTSTPPTDRVRVTYTAGYGEDDLTVPADLAHAVLDHCAKLYDQRGCTDRHHHAGLSPAAARIAARYRRVRL